MLVFYPSSRAGALLRPPGATFVAICRIVFCNHLEMVKAEGAAVKDWVADGGPQPEDDAMCTPNPLQFNAWRAAEASSYRIFYAIAGTITAIVLIASWLHTWKAKATDGEHTSRRNLWLFLGSLSLAVRVWDWMTDWGFYGLAVTTPRLAYLMDDSGLVGSNWSFGSFKTASVFFCVVSTICLPFDLYGFYERTEAIIRRQRPPIRAVYLGLGILCIEDLPQFSLGLMYIDLIRNDPGSTVDAMAVLSVLMSVVGMVFTLLLFFKPSWFHETDKAVEAMPVLEIEHTLWGTPKATSSTSRGHRKPSIADTLVARRETLAQQKNFHGQSAAVTLNPSYNAGGVSSSSSAAAPDYASVYEPASGIEGGAGAAAVAADYAVPEQRSSPGRVANNAVYAGGVAFTKDAADTYGTTQTLRTRHSAERHSAGGHNHAKMLPAALYSTPASISAHENEGYLDVAGADSNRARRATMQNATYGTRQDASAAGYRPRSGSVYEVSNVVRDRSGTMQLAATQEGVRYNVPFAEDEVEGSSA